jgi:AcrR family transcriptional regulator
VPEVTWVTSADTLRGMSAEPSPGSPAVRRRENTRARLIEAAEDVFTTKGVKRVTVDDLVGAAGFTRGAFYSNFSSIEEVFFALFEQQSEQMLAVVREAIDAIPEDEFSLESLGQVLERMQPIARPWYVIQTEFTLLALRNEEARRVFRQHREQFESQMVGVIGDVVRLLGREPSIPLTQLTETAIALYLHALGQDGLGIGALNTEELVNLVLPRLIMGLSHPR